MMTTSVETPGAAARICMRGEYAGAHWRQRKEREREARAGRARTLLLGGLLSFNSEGWCVWVYQPRVVPVSKDATLQRKNTRRHSRRWLGTKVT